MQNIFKPGDVKTYKKKVTKDDIATFDTGTVHPVYATFALARDAEWTCRLFVLEMKEEGEEGIGTYLTIDHQSPALLEQEVVFTAKVKKVEKNEIICSYVAEVGGRIIASGEQGQKVLKKKRIEELFEDVRHQH